MKSRRKPRRKPGDVIVLRGVWHKKIHWACAAFVVRDSPDIIAVFWRAGTPNMIPWKRTTPQDFLDNTFELLPSTWKETDVLMLVKPGEAHSVEIMWETGSRKVRCWYVNLQEPLLRTELGFDSMDHMLDIVISPDLSEWRWKDEGEFAEAIAIGVYSPEEAAAIRKEGELAIDNLQKKQSPFCDGWENWLPPAEWGIPPLLEGWDQISRDREPNNE